MKLKARSLILFLTLMFFSVFLAVIPAVAAGSDVVWSNYSIGSNYYLGQTLQLPVVTAQKDGETKTARGIVYTPDGNVKEINFVTFDNVGEYKVEFRAEFGGKIFSRKHSVTVGNRIVTTAVSTDRITYSEQTAAGKAGLEVVMEQGSSLTINHVVDFRRFSSDTSVLEIFITPSEAGKRDFAGLKIEMTDVYDRSNKVVINYVARTEIEERMFSTVYAGTEQSSLKGIYPGDGNAYEISEGKGSIIATSFYGGEYVSNSIQLRYDNIRNQVFGAIRTDSLKIGDMNLSSIISDVDSVSLYTNPFQGFKTGEVILSVTPYNFSGKEASLVITDIAGVDLSSGNFYTDPIIPEIYVDYGDYSADNVPFALAGKPYKIFTATADNGSAVETCVYRDYYTSSRVELEITDNAFTPDRAGNYSIVFTAEGNYGNTVEKVLSVKAYKESDLANTYVLKNHVEYEGQLTGKAGFAVALPGQTYEGGIGKVKTYVAVRYEGENEEICASDYFFPEIEGDYTVVYYAEDYAGQVAKTEIALRIDANSDPVFSGTITLPKYFIAGKSYKLPDWIAYIYGQNKEEIKGEISVTGGVLVNDVFIPSENASVAEITYSAVSGSSGTSKKFTVPVVNVINESNLDLGKYFYTENLSYISDNKYINFSVSDLSEDSACMEFINALFAEYFSIDFFVAEQSNLMESVDIILIDSENVSEQIFLRLKKGVNNSAFVQVNGKGVLTPVSVTFAGNAQNEYFSVGYDSYFKSFTCDNRTFAVEETSEGEPFAGFTSGKVYLKLKINGISGSSAVGVRKVNNQIITKVIADTIAPQIITKDFFGMYQINTELIIPAAYSMDVLDPEIDFTLTVRDGSGQVVKDKNGKLLSGVDPTRDYTIKLESYGAYSFVYLSKDSSAKTTKYQVAITVVDQVAPIIELSKGYSQTLKPGTVLNIEKATVTDNVDENMEYSVMLKDPYGHIEQITGESVKLNEKGKYVLSYFAIDSSGNIATLKYNITVR